ncbi:MAG: DUF1211 domain-containing protein, partial [Alphaproteobacteria bacterium]|nr:DUF1211 domain-containing protein [Alphaproteobacteria bacterium]
MPTDTSRHHHQSIATTRLEAFSDGVLAIIITIMVLEVHVPKEPTWAALAAIWPTLVAYALSFIYVAIYWVNHHRLLDIAPHFSVKLHWTNAAMLFFLSLVPVTTGWIATFPLMPVPTATYLISLLLPGVAYVPLHREVVRLYGREIAPAHILRAENTKQIASILLYAGGAALAFVHPVIA